MENGSDGTLQEVNLPPAVTNGEISPVTAGYSEIEVTVIKEDSNNDVKVNGDTAVIEHSSNEPDSSDCDALVIDESVNQNKSKVKRKQLIKSKGSGFKGFSKATQKPDALTNPLFSESLNELSELLHDNEAVNAESTCRKHRKPQKSKTNPKLREYAQYLGLQPTVQFKCSKCAQSGFVSLAALNEHHMHCTAEAPLVQSPNNAQTTPSTNIRVTRKVFLCSACGTYYENWNLFLHMREVHKRFICLYCLGMFSYSEKLAQHLVLKHSCVPGRRDSAEDFFHLYKEPCFLMCCDCERVFSEQDNFFSHTCVKKPLPEQKTSKLNNQKEKHTKCKQPRQKPQIEHVTADSAANDSEPTQNGDITDVNTQNNDPDVCDALEDATMATQETEETAALSSDSQNESSKIADAVDAPNCEEKPTTESPQEDFGSVVPEGDANVRHEEAEQDVAEDGDSRLQFDSSREKFDEEESFELAEETRRVPKVTLKLPKAGSYPELVQEEDTNDSTKINTAMEPETDDYDSNSKALENKEETAPSPSAEPQMQIAGPDIAIVELELEQPLDKFDIKALLRKCLSATVPTCIYCNHARKIAVCGKQLGLHAIAEHRFSAVVNSITAEELIPESFVSRIQESLSELEAVYFNIEESSGGDSRDETVATFSHVFECFQCRFATAVHKELYLHNRKSHAKTILLCIMCKSNFYSYSELICHLCPGVYALDGDVRFRCCVCASDDLPSAFRLMVHLRKRHNACDVCLEPCHSQSKLSNHVWKHKLHHLCYRCGIAYRNKPDITKHLFWKHGTESVLCKKCLQKKWPHVYHFCVPPASFVCEECGLAFTRAVALKVHRRTHSDAKPPHSCTVDGCGDSFISKKLLLKHEFKHREPQEEAKVIEAVEPAVEDATVVEENPETREESNAEELLAAEKPAKPKVDVYDLPALNLSESDSSDSEEGEKDAKPSPGVGAEEQRADEMRVDEALVETQTSPDEKPHESEMATGDVSVPIIENIWDDFKNYQANIGKLDAILTDTDKPKPSSPESNLVEDNQNLVDIIMKDHDYCSNADVETHDELNEVTADTLEALPSMDHDYCASEVVTEQKPDDEIKPLPSSNETDAKPNAKKKRANSSSSDSSDSDSSSCTCGSNCSCSSSSGSSSSTTESSESDSSTSEGRRKQQARRERRKERQKTRSKGTKGAEDAKVAPLPVVNQVQQAETVPIQESDLETTESETDEDFYDEQPQKLANQILAEKRNQLLAELGPVVANGETIRPPTPSLPDEINKKKKSKSKKRKKKKSAKYGEQNPVVTSNPNIPNNYHHHHQFYHTPTVAPLTLTLSRNSPVSAPLSDALPPIADNTFGNISDTDQNLRASKRRRVPNKFYGYSSEEEQEKQHPPQPKWRKSDLTIPNRQPPPPVSSPLLVPPITIKTVQPQQHAVEPISIRASSQPGEMRIRRPVPGIDVLHHRAAGKVNVNDGRDSGTESNDSSSDEGPMPLLKPNQPALYCYCRCPYDEVSEMIGCDSSDCAIEWFHFECVGIMVPPKGQWFCPDCRKKKQQKRDLLQMQT